VNFIGKNSSFKFLGYPKILTTVLFEYIRKLRQNVLYVKLSVKLSWTKFCVRYEKLVKVRIGLKSLRLVRKDKVRLKSIRKIAYFLVQQF